MQIVCLLTTQPRDMSTKSNLSDLTSASFGRYHCTPKLQGECRRQSGCLQRQPEDECSLFTKQTSHMSGARTHGLLRCEDGLLWNMEIILVERQTWKLAWLGRGHS